MHLDLIGGGIGGLTTAIALKRKGFSVRIYEQAPEFKPVGAGIILANNAMQVYDKIGLKAMIEEKSNHISGMNITKPDLKPISKVDLIYFEKKYGVSNRAIHRADLIDILVGELDRHEIILGHSLSEIRNDDPLFELKFENGHLASSNILIAADGVNSKVRNHLFPKIPIRTAQQICWRGVTSFDLPEAYQSVLTEAWGRGSRFGFVKLTNNLVYWYALESRPENGNYTDIDKLSDLFNSYHPMVKELIVSTKLEQIHTAEIADFKPFDKWQQGNICLMGDAAHATTPNLGQGACQAIEDAYILGEVLAKYPSTEAFEKFETLRKPKAHHIVKASWFLGKLAHLSNPIAIGLRNSSMRMTPPFLNRKQSERIFKLVTVDS